MPWKLTREGNGIKAEEVYFVGPKEFENHHGGVVLVGDYLYGGDGQNRGRARLPGTVDGQNRLEAEVARPRIGGRLFGKKKRSRHLARRRKNVWIQVFLW